LTSIQANKVILAGLLIAYVGPELKFCYGNGPLVLIGNTFTTDNTEKENNNHLLWWHSSPVLPFAYDQRDAYSADQIIMRAAFSIKSDMPG
jgi:hypothetical protein